ncbi:MAG: hypothetical protein FJ034_00950 [Chloroflexi bacterium]|nr:hypothetical protein [Chloroflexota bacterium]
MSTRGAGPTDLVGFRHLLRAALEHGEGLLASALPQPFASGAVGSWAAYLPGVLGLGGRLRVFVDDHRGELRSVALVYDGRRPEWVLLTLASAAVPEGPDSAFRLLSEVAASAARAGMQRLFAAVPLDASAQEPFFQAGFYSYTREAWYVSGRSVFGDPGPIDFRDAGGGDAHDLFRLYVATTPHAVQRAEQLSMEDFDPARRSGMYDQPHLIGGNPLAMRRTGALVATTGDTLLGVALAFAGTDLHPHVLRVRTRAGDVDHARDLVRLAARRQPPGRPMVSPIRSYEEHVARALLAEGFREAGTAMLFVKELAVRIEEPAFAPAVVR